MPRRTAKRVSQKVPESGVLKACLKLLEVEHIFHRRWNSGSAKVDNGDGTQRFFRFGSKGDGDILALPLIRNVAHVLWIETKSDSGKQTFDQKIFQKIRGSTGPYISAGERRSHSAGLAKGARSQGIKSDGRGNLRATNER